MITVRALLATPQGLPWRDSPGTETVYIHLTCAIG